VKHRAAGVIAAGGARGLGCWRRSFPREALEAPVTRTSLLVSRRHVAGVHHGLGLPQLPPDEKDRVRRPDRGRKEEGIRCGCAAGSLDGASRLRGRMGEFPSASSDSRDIILRREKKHFRVGSDPLGTVKRRRPNASNLRYRGFLTALAGLREGYPMGQPTPQPSLQGPAGTRWNSAVSMRGNQCANIPPKVRFPGVRTGHRQTCLPALRWRTSWYAWNARSAFSRRATWPKEFGLLRGIVQTRWGALPRSVDGPGFPWFAPPGQSCEALIGPIPMEIHVWSCSEGGQTARRSASSPDQVDVGMPDSGQRRYQRIHEGPAPFVSSFGTVGEFHSLVEVSVRRPMRR